MIAILGMANAAWAHNGQFRSRCSGGNMRGGNMHGGNIRAESHTARIPARLSRAGTLCERKNWQSCSTRSTHWSLPSRLSRSTTKNILRVGGGRDNQLYIHGKPTGFCRGPRQGDPTAYSTFNCNDRNRTPILRIDMRQAATSGNVSMTIAQLAAANAQLAAQRAPAPAPPAAVGNSNDPQVIGQINQLINAGGHDTGTGAIIHALDAGAQMSTPSRSDKFP